MLPETATVREAREDEREAIFPLLLLAEPSAGALRWSLKNLSDSLYVLEDGGRVVGAATMRFHREPCEIVELGVARGLHGRGYGRRLVGWLLEEARGRGKREVFVGTRSTSAGNLIFYQKCGFRVHGVRPDYFWYYDEPVYENGLLVRDMIVLRYDPAEGQPTAAATTRRPTPAGGAPTPAKSHFTRTAGTPAPPAEISTRSGRAAPSPT